MASRILSVAVTVLYLVHSATLVQGQGGFDVLDFINPFIGTDNGGEDSAVTNLGNEPTLT